MWLVIIIAVSLLHNSCNYFVEPQLEDDWSVSDPDLVTVAFSDSTGFEYLEITGSAEHPVEARQSVKMDQGEFFLYTSFFVEIAKGSFSIKVLDGDGKTLKYVEIISDEEFKYRPLLSFRVNEDQENITFVFGFSEKSTGKAIVNRYSLHQQQYYKNKKSPQPDQIAILLEGLGMKPFEESNYDANNEHAARLLNNTLLQQDSEGNESFFFKEEFPMGDMHYFPGYLLEAGKTNGYCQRVSLSLGEVLRSMGVKSRQLHWQKDGVGFHQFIEYYNPYSDQWIIIDPYYGVKYKDKAGHFLGFEGIDQLKRAGTFDLSRIHKIEVNRFYFSEEEIINGWNADLAIHIL